MHGTYDGSDGPTTDLSGQRAFPEPAVVVSLRRAMTYRVVDDDNQPVLIITDGVSTVALECGLGGLSFNVVVAAQRLGDAVADFATSIGACFLTRESRSLGHHRRNRRRERWPRRGSGNSGR